MATAYTNYCNFVFAQTGKLDGANLFTYSDGVNQSGRKWEWINKVGNIVLTILHNFEKALSFPLLIFTTGQR